MKNTSHIVCRGPAATPRPPLLRRVLRRPHTTPTPTAPTLPGKRVPLAPVATGVLYASAAALVYIVFVLVSNANIPDYTAPQPGQNYVIGNGGVVEPPPQRARNTDGPTQLFFIDSGRIVPYNRSCY